MEAILMAELGMTPDPAYVLSTAQMVLYAGTIMFGVLMMVAGLLGDSFRSNGFDARLGIKLLMLLGFATWLGSVYLWPFSVAFLVVLSTSLPPLAAGIVILFWVGSWCATTYMLFAPKQVQLLTD